MSEIINISAYSPVQQIGRQVQFESAAPTRAGVAAAEDTVELSDFGRSLAEAADLSTYRLARVRAVRAEIEQGVYESPERLDGAVDRILDVLS